MKNLNEQKDIEIIQLKKQLEYIRSGKYGFVIGLKKSKSRWL